MKQLIPDRSKSFLICASLAASLMACAAPAAPAAAPTIPELAIEFTGTEFKVPADVPGGIVAVTVNNTSGKLRDIGLRSPEKTTSAIITIAV